MDSDVDNDIPVRIKPNKKPQTNETKSPLFVPYPPNSIRSQNALSPSSNYSIKSSKDKIDIAEIRRVLTKLKAEIEHEKKRNQELVDNNFKELDQQRQFLESKHSNTISQLTSSWKSKLDESLKNSNNQTQEIDRLKQKLNELSIKTVQIKTESQQTNMDDIVAKINEFCNLDSKTFCNTDELLKIINDLNQLVRSRVPKHQTEVNNVEIQVVKLKHQNAELTNIVKILDRKLKTSQNEIKELTKKLDEKQDIQEKNKINDETINFERLLKTSNSERLQLEKQLTWLQKNDDTDPATRERVEVLTTLLRSFKKNQIHLESQLAVLQDKSDKVESLINEISLLKKENEKLSQRLTENSADHKSSDKLKSTLDFNQLRDQEKSIKIQSLENLNSEYQNKITVMDRLLKYIRETSDKRTELEMEYAAMKALLETKLRNDFTKRETAIINRDDHSDDSTETLKAELRELEKRCTQQALNYEEALLELESLKKNNQRYNVDYYQRNGTKEDVNNSAASGVMEESIGFNNEEFGKGLDSFGLKTFTSTKPEDRIDIKRETAIFGRSDTNSTNIEEDKNPIHNNTKIPAPCQIKVENHPSQKNTRIVRWKAPEIDINIDKCIITSYHIYVDGHFYKGISVSEPHSAVLPVLDVKKSHRIVIRSVCSQGQSKDAQCTIEIGSFSLAPSSLKANKITGTSAQISWIPSNSNWRHSVWVNGAKYCDCLAGVYKIVMQGLVPDSLQKVQVHPVIDRFVDNSPTANNCSHLDFQTLPVYDPNFDEAKKPTDEIEYPKDVKLKLGSRPGKFIVKWVCPQQNISSNIKMVGYSILINNQCVALVNGAKNDRFTINLQDLRTINPPTSQNLLNHNDQSYLSLTVRTMATITQTSFDNEVTECTIYSKDSQPVLRFSGHVAARIAGTAAEAAIVLGDQLASFLNLMEANSGEMSDRNTVSKRKQSQSPKSTKEYPQAKISVPKIQITKDSSFSEDDENSSVTAYRNKGRVIDQYGKVNHQQKPVSRNYGDYKNRSNPSIDEISIVKNQTYASPQIDRVNSHNQWSSNYQQEKANIINNDRYNYVNQKPIDNIRYFVALFDYDPATMSPNSGAIHEELPFKAGQNIKVFGQVDEDGFYTGETNGRRGLVPSNMVSEIEVKSKFKSIENVEAPFQDRVQMDRNKDPMLTRSLQGKLNMEQYPQDAQIDYQTNQQQYQYNQYPLAHRKSTDSAVSYAASDPNSYQRPQMGNYVPRQSSAGTTRKTSDYRKMLALYDYDPQTLSPNVDSDAELAFKSNDIIMIIGDMDEDGFFMGEKNGQRGLVPSNFLTELPPPLENRSRNPPNYQSSFDNTQIPNQYKERNFSSGSNYSDPPPVRDTRVRPKPFEAERSPLSRNPLNNNDEYIPDRIPHIENQKNNPSFEESFDSGPPGPRPYMVKPDPKSNAYQNNNGPRMSIHDQIIDNKPMQYPNVVPPNNKMPNRSNKPITDRRSSHDKPIHRNQPSMNLPPRDLSPPPPLEVDDMPIVMDLAPSKENQVSKRYRARKTMSNSNSLNNFPSFQIESISNRNSLIDNFKSFMTVKFANPLSK